jgi:hypothetical protein
VFAVDDGEDRIDVLAAAGSDAAITARIDQLLAAGPRMAAIVTVTGWTPDGTSAVQPAWVVTAVGTGGIPALGAVRRIREVDRWTRLASSELPWFALVTAAGLRAGLAGSPLHMKRAGSPLHMKRGGSAELHHRPDDQPDPPVDEHARL